MNENYPCKCGHDKKAHDGEVKACWLCLGEYINSFSLTDGFDRICSCFKLDNLGYLEQRYTEKILEPYKKLEAIKEK